MRYIVLAALLIASLVVRTPAFAQSDEPFMTIRFNQARMYFDQQLYNTVSKAVSIKQDVMFDAVSYVPATGDAEQDKKWQQKAQSNLALVVQRMNAIGVPSSRIATSLQPQQGLRFDEVRLFAH